MALIRLAKIILALAIGIWGLVGLFGNLVAVTDVYADVERVTSMAQVPEGEGPPWASSNPIVVWLGVLAIILGKVAAVIAGFGAIIMMLSLSASEVIFRDAKQTAIAGCGLAFAINFAAFTVFGESIFFMFYAGNLSAAGELGFRFSACFALAALFITQDEGAT